MRDPNNRIRNLAERAWTLSKGDLARTIKILREMTGLSFELAYEVLEEVAAFDKIQMR